MEKSEKTNKKQFLSLSQDHTHDKRYDYSKMTVEFKVKTIFWRKFRQIDIFYSILYILAD